MNVEKIFRQVAAFSGIVLDKILFESKYPVMFTCKKDNDIYLFICCMVSASKVEWIGTKTDYDTLIGLLENKITIREAFLNVTDEKYLVKYDGSKVFYMETKVENIPDKLLPSAGEYMDAEEGEYAEEIKVFESRNRNFEYRIQPCINSIWILNLFVENINLSDEYFNIVLMLSWAVMISPCHAVMRLPRYLSWNVPFDGAAVRPITKRISSYIHALPAL